MKLQMYTITVGYKENFVLVDYILLEIMCGIAALLLLMSYWWTFQLVRRKKTKNLSNKRDYD